MLGRILVTTAVLAVVTMILPVPATAADGPQDQDAGAGVTSYLHTVTPSVLGPDDELTLAGVVENTGDEPLTNVQVLPRWSNVQLETREEIRQVASDTSLRWGYRRSDPYQVVAERLDPGERQEFRLTFDDTEQLGFGLAGVYVIGVDVRGTLTTGERTDLDTVRTVIPWMPDGETPDPVQVSLIWPVEATPSLTPDGTLVNDALAGRLRPGGALHSVVDAAGDSPVSWLVDPDVLDTVEAMSAGAEVESESADTSTDEASELAGSWRSAFNDARGDNTALLLPYARPDTGSLVAADPPLASRITSAAAELTTEAARTMRDVRTGVAWPGGGVADDRTLATLADAGVRTVILSGNAVSPHPEHPLAEIQAADAALDAVVTDPGLDAVLADAYTAPNAQAGALELQQRWAAETAMVALEAQALDQSPQPLIVAPPARWTPEPAVASAVIDTWTSLPWVTPTTVDDLDRPAAPATVAPVPDDSTNALPGENASATGELETAAEDYVELLADPAPGLSESLGRATVRSASEGWRDDPAAGADYAGEIIEELTDPFDEVHVTVPESVTLSSRTGVFPLTVSNDLDQPVTVKLDIHAANPDRLRVGEVEEQRVEAGSRQTIQVQAEAVTNGRVPITVQLVTKDGSPLGIASRTVVNATDYGTVGWFIIGGAVLLFGGSVLRTMLRRRRSEDSDAADPPDDRPDAAGDTADAAGDTVDAGRLTASTDGQPVVGSTQRVVGSGVLRDGRRRRMPPRPGEVTP
ncbi:DUF6049 family protein [Phytoactinopolyspora halotolerans]|uniref:Secreted protein n=1 Tax=Phytoactinopolyspora halotolerans TaxID=1981512 RepID=A0A6L9S0H5_9ACTN|nr:DUF6049 family protein [Phytoactinopolyspora halotolerans]NED98685.1 hypothetical protein [Phytoactinopolyspora halotolerans]